MNPDDDRGVVGFYVEEEKNLRNEILDLPNNEIPSSKTQTMPNNSNFFARPTGQETGKNKDKPKVEMSTFYSPVLVNDDVEAERVEIGQKKEEFVTPPKTTGIPQQVNFLEGFDFYNLLSKKVDVKLSTKILIVYFLLTMIISIVLSGLEIGYLFQSACPDHKKDQDLQIIVIIGYAFAILLKIITLGYLNLELINKPPYVNPYTFSYPILWLGIIPTLQLPQIVYDYVECYQRNPLIKLGESQSILIAVLVAVGALLIFQGTLYIGRYKFLIQGSMYTVMRISFLIFGMIVIIPLNVLTVLVTFTQLPEFIPSFFFENQFFYLMSLFMLVSNYIKHVRQWEYIFAAQREADFVGIVDNQGTS